jgi:hypothetical protein
VIELVNEDTDGHIASCDTPGPGAAPVAGTGEEVVATTFDDQAGAGSSAAVRYAVVRRVFWDSHVQGRRGGSTASVTLYVRPVPEP